MKNLLSRYHPRYVRSLVYMMQASEYHIRDFLRWFWRTRDFLRVEQRKSLVKTPKSLLFLIAGYAVLFFLYVFAFGMLVVAEESWKYPAFLLTAFVAPYLLVDFFIGLMVLSRIVQIPVEYGILVHAKRKLKAHKGFRIAIAGSFGKTSMREILKTVLGAGKRVAAPPGSYNTPLGISSFIRSLGGDEEILVFELGEYYPGDIRRLCKLVAPDIGIITGVNEAHLAKFGSIGETRKTIFELAGYFRDRPLYINGENILARTYARTGDILYSRAGAGEWRVEDAKASLKGTLFMLRNGPQRIQAESHLLGLHQVGPLSVAADIACKLGISTERIGLGIQRTKPFEHRLEPKTDTAGVITLDDSYNGNPDGVRAVLEFLSSLKNVRRWYLTPGLVEMGAKKEEVHMDIGRELARAHIDKVVLIRNSVTPLIEKGLQEENYKGEIMWFDRALDAFAALPNLTVKGDVVVLQNDWPDQYA